MAKEKGHDRDREEVGRDEGTVSGSSYACVSASDPDSVSNSSNNN